MSIFKELIPIALAIVPAFIYPKKKEVLRDVFRARAGRLFEKSMAAHQRAQDLTQELNDPILQEVKNFK